MHFLEHYISVCRKFVLINCSFSFSLLRIERKDNSMGSTQKVSPINPDHLDSDYVSLYTLLHNAINRCWRFHILCTYKLLLFLQLLLIIRPLKSKQPTMYVHWTRSGQTYIHCSSFNLQPQHLEWTFLLVRTPISLTVMIWSALCIHVHHIMVYAASSSPRDWYFGWHWMPLLLYGFCFAVLSLLLLLSPYRCCCLVFYFRMVWYIGISLVLLCERLQTTGHGAVSSWDLEDEAE